MKHILSRSNRRTLERIADSHVLLAFDFDGTLAPTVARRSEASMRAVTRRLFLSVCALYPCAVISGRARKDVSAKLSGTSVKYVVGNHGSQPDLALPKFKREVQKAWIALEGRLRHFPGIDIEDKGYSVAVHFRGVRNEIEALGAICDAIAMLPTPMRAVHGKLVVDIMPTKAPNKGNALLKLYGKEGAERMLYIGDDTTDEDVFALKPHPELLTIRVGSSSSSSADFFLRDQREVDTLLKVLRSLRQQEA